MSEAEALVGLNLLRCIGGRRLKKLLEYFTRPQDIIDASTDKLRKVEGIGERVAWQISNLKKEDIDREFGLIKKHNVDIISLYACEYPENLKKIYDPPIALYVKGRILPEDYFSIAIVGTRLASFYGRTMAERLSRELSEKGFTIVSGGARGIDSFSHQSALRADGRTLAVLGCGLDIVYPPENKRLFEDICAKGALISEFPLGTRPDKQNFPMRNRIISGLSLGVAVIEAPRKSGALITVTHAIEQGREVFSVPGKADSFVSKGTNQLLREGAKLAENADDIIEELEPILKSKIKELRANQPSPPEKKQVLKEAQLSQQEAQVYNLLSAGPLDFDDIIVQSQLPAGVACAMLTRLELKKLVKQSPGKIFVKA